MTKSMKTLVLSRCDFRPSRRSERYHQQFNPDVFRQWCRLCQREAGKVIRQKRQAQLQRPEQL